MEVILVATLLGNDQWHHTPREMFPKYLDALKSLAGAEGTASNGIALADLTSLWTEMRNSFSGWPGLFQAGGRRPKKRQSDVRWRPTLFVQRCSA